MKSILIAEGHRPTLDLLQQTLAEAGYRSLVATDTAEAYERCISERPDAVLLAADLPRLEGASLGKLLHEAGVAARLPLLAIDKGHLGKAKGVGGVLDLMVNGYVADPTRRQEVLARLEQLLADVAKAPAPSKGIAATLARPPTAGGELKSRSLAASVHSWYRIGRDGILVLACRQLSRRIYFLRGSPVNYASNARQDSLASWMLERKALTPESHAAMLSAMNEDGLSPGAALVAVGAVDAGEPLLGLLRDYLRAKAAEALAMDEGRFSFYAGDEFAAEVPSVEVPALAVLYESARDRWPARAFAAALAPNMAKYPTRAPEFAKDLAVLGLTSQELKIALEITGQQTLREVLSANLKRALPLFWYLTLVGALKYGASPSRTGGGATPPYGNAKPRAAAARRKKPLPEAKAGELREEAIRVLTSSYFGALRLDITADGEAVERAYHDAATRFHPDTYSEFELGPIEDLLASVQDKISAAYRVLSEEGKRKAYLQHLVGRADVARSGSPNADAEIALKRGENAMRKGDWKGALKSFEQAVSLNPREPEYFSYLAWATFKAGEGERDARAKAARKLIKNALSINPTLERPQVIAAIIEDELEQHAEARRMLLKVLKANPESELAKKVLQGLNRRRGVGEKT